MTSLIPARFVASFMTGKMMSNDDPVVRLQEFCPPDLDAGLIEHALACRRAATDPDALFLPARCYPARSRRSTVWFIPSRIGVSGTSPLPHRQASGVA
jgi:hypothetical protein